MVGQGHRVGRSDLAALGVLVLVVVLGFHDVVLGGRTLSVAAYVPGVLPGGPVGATPGPIPPPTRDLEGAAWVDEPAPYLVHAALRAGRAPLWSDASGLGMPLLGNPNSGAIAPLQWVVNLWPSSLVQDLAWLGRVLVLGLSTWLLAREIGCRITGALVAATSIMLSGQTLDWIDHHPLNTDAFVPLAVYAAMRLPARGARGVALLAMAIAAGLLGVKPQSALVAGIVGGFWLVADGVDRRTVDSAGPSLARRLPAWGAGVVLGVGLAGIALLPFVETYEHASGLVRAGRTSQSEWSLPLGAWSGLAGPWALGLAGATAPDLAGGPTLPHAGVGVLALALAGLLAARRRRLAWALAGTVALLWARIHGLVPVSLTEVPLLGSVNVVKYCFPLYLALALLAGMGVDALGRGRARLAAVIALALFAELLWLGRRERPLRVSPYAPAPYVEALHRELESQPGRMSGPVDLAPPLVSGALGLRDLRAIDVLTPELTWQLVSSSVASSQGVTWILADPDPLLAATAPAGRLVDLGWVLSRQPLDAAKLEAAARSHVSAQRLVRLFSGLIRLSTETASLGGGILELAGDRRFHWTCLTPCRFRFELDALPDGFVVGFASQESVRAVVRLSARGPSGTETSRHETLDLTPGSSWTDLWIAPPIEPRGAGPGVVELSIEAPLPVPVFVGGVGPSRGDAAERARLELELAARRRALSEVELRWSDATAHVYRTRRPFGSAFFAERIVPMLTPDQVDLCILEAGDVAVACVAAAEIRELRSPVSLGSAVVLAEHDAETLVATSSEDAGLLVFTRLFYPGWEARIDDRRAPLLRVNGATIGVVVPPGRHWIELTYRPRSVWIGAAVSMASALVLVGLLVVGGRAEGDRV